MRALLLALALAATGCVKSNAVLCGDVTCPFATHCGPQNQCIPDDCGNGVVDDLEECDGNDSIDHATLRCTDYSFYQGPVGEQLTCSSTCEIDTSACSEFCGDYTVNGTERCDGIPPTGFSCSDFGFDVGTIGCSNACAPAIDFCANIGWQVLPGGGSHALLALALITPDTGIAVGRSGEVIAAVNGVWLSVSQSVTSEDLNGVIATPNGIIAVGNNGTIIRYDGTTTTKMTSPTLVHLRGISGGANGAIAVGDNGTILRFDGTTWSTMVSPVSEQLFAVHVDGPGSAYAVGAHGTVLRLQGTTWSKLILPTVPDVTLYAVFVVDGVPFVTGEGTTIARLESDTAATVLPFPFDIGNALDMRAMWAASPSDLYVAGRNGVVLHWNGAYFTQHDSPTTRLIHALDGVAGRVFGVTGGGTVLGFSGTSRHVQQPTNAALNAVYTDEARTVVAGDNVVLSFGPDGTWQPIGVPSSLVFHYVFALGTATYAGSRVDGLFMENGGSGSLTQVSAAPVFGIWGTADRIVTVGLQVIESTDGVTFPQTSTTTAHGANYLRSVWAAPDGTWFAVGHSGTVIRRLPGGSWTAMSAPTTNHLIGVWGAASDDVFAVGELGTILHWNGTGWRKMHSGTAENLLSISGNTGSDVFVTGTSFMRLHYDGIGWSRMNTFGLDSPALSTYRGTTYYVTGPKVERQDRVVSATERECSDPFDNDGADGTNCDDPDCLDDAQCRRGGACETLERVTCETTALAATTFTGVARLTDLPCLDHSTPGPEASYRYVALATGEVTVTIDDPTQQLDLVVTDALAGHCQLETCRSAVENGTAKSVTFTATEGRIYYFVVDGPVGVGGSFTLTVSCE